MSTPRSPKRILRLFLILVFGFGLVSWLLTLHFASPSSSTSTLLTKEHHIPEAFELPNTLNLSQSSPWSKDSWVQEREYQLNVRQTVPELSFLQRLQIYETQGHNTSALLQLPTTTSNDSNNTITAIVRAIDKQSLRMQLDALTSQIMPIHILWIVCSASLQTDSESYATKHRSSNLEILVINSDDIFTTTRGRKVYPDQSAGSSAWLPLLSRVQTDYVWILEDGVSPNSDYLKTIYGLMQTEEYKDALLGSHATLLPANLNPVANKKVARSQLHCLPAAFHFLPKLTQPVDMLHHVWFLRASWIPYLLMDRRMDSLSSPLPYYISQSLLSQASIPSIVIPPPPLSSSSATSTSTTPLLLLNNLRSSVSCINVIPTAYQQSGPWKRILALRSNPTALDQRQRSLMTTYETTKMLLFIDGPNEAKAFLPLLCRFTSSSNGTRPATPMNSLHVVVSGKQRGFSGALLSTIINSTSDCPIKPVIHDLDLYVVSDPRGIASQTSLLLSRLVQALQPRIFLHIQQDTPMFHALDLLAKSHHLSTIQLPADEIKHALWISNLPLDTLQYWNHVKLDLVVITDRRPHSLSRLLNSIGHSKYLGDKVDLTIHMEQSADRVTRMFVNSFYWEQGAKIIRHRIRKGGLMPAIIESWYPSDNNHYGVILEDDIEVSPLFYAWAKYNILHYRYNHDNAEAYPWMYGVSLYSPRNLELMPEGRISFDPNDVLLPADYPPRTPYASQVPCSWGAVYFPEHWREFHQYLTSRLLDLESSHPRLNIFVPGSRSERWKKSWKKYYIEMVYLRAYVMVYPNFQDFESFSTNHLEFGTHIKHDRAQGAIDSFVVPLMQRDTLINQLPNERLPSIEQLPVMDLWGKLMTHEEMDDIAANWHQHVSACTRRQSFDRFDPQDMLCPFPIDHTTTNTSTSAVTTKKKPVKTPPKTKHMLEHIEYVTVYLDEHQQHDNGATDDSAVVFDMDTWDERPEPLDVASMTTSASDHAHEDDEFKDLEENWDALLKMTRPQSPST